MFTVSLWMKKTYTRVFSFGTSKKHVNLWKSRRRSLTKSICHTIYKRREYRICHLIFRSFSRSVWEDRYVVWRFLLCPYSFLPKKRDDTKKGEIRLLMLATDYRHCLLFMSSIESLTSMNWSDSMIYGYNTSFELLTTTVSVTRNNAPGLLINSLVVNCNFQRLKTSFTQSAK